MSEIRREDITLDSLSEEQRDIAEIIGIDNYIDLVEHIDGDTIYIPRRENVFGQIEREARDRRILADYQKGYTVKQLSQKYDLVGRYIYTILADVRKANEKRD